MSHVEQGFEASAHSASSRSERLRQVLGRDFRGGRPNLGTLVWLLVIAGGIQFVMLRPPFPSDSLAYFAWAENLGGNAASHGTTRLGVLLPVYLAIQIFGYSEAAYYIVPFLLGLVLTGSVYVAGSLLANSRVGVVAALAMISSTLVLDHTSQIVPDPFAAAWFVLSVTVLLVAKHSPVPNALLGLAGLAFGVAYLCREYVMFLAPVILIIGWWEQWQRKHWLWFVVGATLVLVAELFMMGVLFDDPFARIKALTGFAERAATGESELLAAYAEDATRWTVLTRAPGAFAASDVGSLLIWSIPIAVVGAIVDRSSRGAIGFLLLWVAGLWIPMMLLAGILDPTTPRIRDNHVRYWSLVIPALFLLLAVTGAALIRAARFRWLQLVATLGLLLLLMGALVSDVRAVPDNERFRGNGATQWDEVRDWLRAEGARVDIIYTDARMARVLPLYTREIFGDPIWNGDIAVFESGGEFVPADQLDGALLIHELGLRYLRNRGLTLPDGYWDLGPAWEVAARRADGSLTILMEAG